MSSSCLSAATIVRCQTLSKSQNGVIFIPVVVQTIFVVLLTAIFWRSKRRKHYWIFAEGWAIYAVSLLDLLAHILPQARQQLQTFRIFDIVTGALSSVPILLYTIFLFVFARSFFLPNLPRLSQTITKYALLVSIPIIVALSELGSFIGISHRLFQDKQGDSLLAIGFASSGAETSWQFFTSVTLVLLIIYQAFTFLITMYLLVSIWRERHLGEKYYVGDRAPRVSGIVWISIGVKLGAIDSVLGFVNGGFPVVLTRRVLRLFSRCCIAFGSVHLEDEPEATGRGRGRTISQIREMISNPRESTFMRLSPTAAGFSQIPPAGEVKHVEGTAQGGPIPRPQRVTVHYDGHSAPALNLRLSDLKVPSAEELTATFQRRGTIIGGSADRRMHGNWESVSTRKSRSTGRSLSRSLYAVAPPSVPELDSFSLPQELRNVLDSRGYNSDSLSQKQSSSRPNPRFKQDTDSLADISSNSYVRGHARFMSGSSLASDSLSIVNALAAEFPGIPPRRTASGKRVLQRERQRSLPASVVLDDVIEYKEKEEKTISPSNSIKRKPPPQLMPALGIDSHGQRADSGVSGASAFTFGAPPQQPKQQQSQESLISSSKISQSSSLKRKNIPIPPPIDSVIARSDAVNSQRVEVSSESAVTSVFEEGSSRQAENPKHNSMRTTPSTTTRGPTPGMTLNSSSSITSTEVDTARNLGGPDDIDPFSDSDNDAGVEFRVSELAAAESGLGRIASKVAQYDRMRRQSYRGVDQPSPVTYSPFDDRHPKRKPQSKRKEKEKGKEKEKQIEKVDFPQQQQQTLSISRPRPLSAQSTSTTSSGLRSAVLVPPTNARRVTVSARRGPAFSNATTHSHTTSVTSTGTRRSHTERELMRVKSVGRVTTRRTPMPTPSSGSFATRSSMKIDSIDYSVSSATTDSIDSPNRSRFRGMYRDSNVSSPTDVVRSALNESWNAESDSDVEGRFNSLTRSDLRS